ncbi:MAG: DUF4127 family protein [Phascolarctobacterium sp.]|nr:DUF4127 family protein [Phascolarctobacterium sp.]
MQIKNILALGLVTNIFFFSPAEAKDLQILFIPLDNRPVCSSYVKESVEGAGIKLIMPPDKFIATHQVNGNPAQLLKWLQEKSSQADAAVISTDSLIYGGLVASRTHEDSADILNARVNALSELARDSKIKLYAFSTIMRTPRASRGRVEPDYYPEVGPSIFAYSELLDKKTQSSLSITEQLTLQALERNLKKDNLGDWLERRKKNFEVNKNLTRLSRMNRFHYLGIGKDDNSPHSATHLESCKLAKETFDMPKDRLAIIDGVDQLGLLLIARAFNEARNLKPNVQILYAPGSGANTLPQYSDAILYDSVPVQIMAAGGTVASDTGDLILAINSPADSIVKDSTFSDNLPFPNVANRSFIAQLQNLLANNKKITLADISYSNGADNGFMETLAKNCDLGQLRAYNGWNTADNAIGYAIAQGMLAQHMKDANREKLLRQRYIDDWFYQSNARPVISKELEQKNREDLKYDLGSATNQILKKVSDDAHAMAKKYAFTKTYDFTLSFPWNRLFEVNVTLAKKPKK